MVENPLSDRVAWRSVWRLLLALIALLVAVWSVGAFDRNPWVHTAAAGPTLSRAIPLDAGGTGLSSDTSAVPSGPAVWTPVVAKSGLAAPVETRVAITNHASGERSPQALSGERGSARAAEFDGLSFVVAVLALLVLVSWRRRDQVVR